MKIDKYNDFLWNITNKAIPTVFFIIIWGMFILTLIMMGVTAQLLINN